MELSFLERALVMNPLRRWVQRTFEIPSLVLAGKGVACDDVVLEIGASCGYGAQCLLKVLSVPYVIALEFDSKMLQRRIRDDRIFYVQGSGHQIPLHDESVNHIFSFGVLHHIENWQGALEECYRVLKNGGELYLEEFYAPLITNRFVHFFIPHPQENRFTHQQLLDEANRIGLKCRYAKSKFGLMGILVLEKA